MGAEGIAKNGSELPDLLRRKTLRFAHVMGAISEELGQEIVESYSQADVFVCTKEFLKENSSIIKVENALTEQLNNQVNNILLSDFLLYYIPPHLRYNKLLELCPTNILFLHQHTLFVYFLIYLQLSLYLQPQQLKYQIHLEFPV